ncbi:MAG: nucleoid-associated protein YgaU [Myxococcota bacterium]|jgi:nucleoid-associated protein YgaU
MGLFSFVKSAGRKVGLFGGREAEEAEQAAEEAKVAQAAAAEAAKTAANDAETLRLHESAVAADIRAAVLSYVEIADLAVTFSGDTATLSGTATAQSDHEKAVLVAGNTEGVGSVDADGLAVEIPEPPAVHHTVVKGDTLSKIAREFYGVMRMYDVVFEANKPMLEHPDLIYPGQVLRIPPTAAPVHTVARGESLGGIAKHWYGDARKYTNIFEANRGTLSDPNVVEVGQRLTIPLIDPKVGSPNIA